MTKNKIKEFIKEHKQLFRFLIVGGGNAILDIGIYTILVHLGVNFYIANVTSTTIAFISSFYFNRSYSFQANDGSLVKQIIKFTLVTVFSLWAIQPVVIWITSPIVPETFFSINIKTIVPKMLGIGVGMIWNYFLYAKLVFNKRVDDKKKDVRTKKAKRENNRSKNTKK